MFDLTTYEGVQARRQQIADSGELQDYYSVDSVAKAAKWLAREGVAVFRLSPGSKRPLTGSNGFHDATTDLDLIQQWWGTNEQYNIGVPTGGLFDVLDVDGPKGFASLAKWIAARGKFQIFGAIYTPNKQGVHLLVPANGNGRKIGIAPGLDGLGTNGYEVMPPSILESGPYVWLQHPNFGGLRNER